MWFTESGSLKIGRITLDGAVQEFPLHNALPQGITLGQDGNLWFTENTTTNYIDPTGNVARITPAGEVTEFPVGKTPSQIAAGPDVNLWYVAWYDTAIGRLTPTGTVTEFGLPRSSFPHGIAAGPDGALWITESRAVGRLSTDGVHTAFTITGATGDESGQIIAGLDNDLWFASDSAGAVGRITTDGTVSVVPLGDGTTSPVSGIAVAIDGSVWLTDYWNKLIVRFQP
jgi:streptogramin lyase